MQWIWSTVFSNIVQNTVSTQCSILKKTLFNLMQICFPFCSFSLNPCHSMSLTLSLTHTQTLQMVRSPLSPWFCFWDPGVSANPPWSTTCWVFMAPPRNSTQVHTDKNWLCVTHLISGRLKTHSYYPVITSVKKIRFVVNKPQVTHSYFLCWFTTRPTICCSLS